MNKLFIGLLLAAAAGTGIYFYLNNKKEKTTTAKNNKELIIGKWKTISYEPATDTIQPLYQYHFEKEGKLYRQANDTVEADTLYYDWSKANELIIKENKTDTLANTYHISKLIADTLQLKAAGTSLITNLQRIK